MSNCSAIMTLHIVCVCSVLLGVLDQRASDKIFQATIERRLALLLGDALGTGRRFKRATSVGNNSVQVCKSSVLCGLILFMLSMHELIGFIYRALPVCMSNASLDS